MVQGLELGRHCVIAPDLFEPLRFLLWRAELCLRLQVLLRYDTVTNVKQSTWLGRNTRFQSVWVDMQISELSAQTKRRLLLKVYCYHSPSDVYPALKDRRLSCINEIGVVLHNLKERFRSDIQSQGLKRMNTYSLMNWANFHTAGQIYNLESDEYFGAWINTFDLRTWTDWMASCFRCCSKYCLKCSPHWSSQLKVIRIISPGTLSCLVFFFTNLQQVVWVST